MARPELRVLIVGGGIGGLCLAQGLKRVGVAFTVFERDRDADARLQGYRLNIEPVGSEALHACLPSHLWNVLVATAGDPGPRMGVFDEQLRELMQEDESGALADARHAHHAVSRVTLRRILLAGLGENVQFGKQFVRYERSDRGRVTAFFADGTAATGDLLVGADGARSAVRRQLLPAARDIDVPAVGIGGKLPLTDAISEWLPRHMATMKNMILPSRDFLFTAAFRRRCSLADAAQNVRNALSDTGVEAEALLSGSEDFDYVMWAFVTHRKTFAQEVSGMDGQALRERIQERTTSWHPTLRRLLAETDASTVRAFDFSAAAGVQRWETSHVTLLGDALHFMPPVGGMGGNAALRDAQLLCAALESVTSGKEDLVPALHRYEIAMIANGFSAVRSSLLYTRLAISRFRPLRSVARLFFRACGRSPFLRRMIFQ